MDLSNAENKEYFLGPINFKYFEIIFGCATFLGVIPQIYKIIKTGKAKDFSMLFINGMIIVNILLI